MYVYIYMYICIYIFIPDIRIATGPDSWSFELARGGASSTMARPRVLGDARHYLMCTTNDRQIIIITTNNNK